MGFVSSPFVVGPCGSACLCVPFLVCSVPSLRIFVGLGGSCRVGGEGSDVGMAVGKD